VNLAQSNLKKLQINADDYGQNASIDAAIIDLANRKVLTSTSALVLSPYWPQAAKSLVGLPIQVGLHLDFTSTFSKQFGFNYSLPTFIFLAYTRLLNAKKIQNMIETQWNKFYAAYGQVPDFIDGHQHVHQLPVVRDALFAVIQKKAWGTKPKQWLRSCESQHWRGLKAGIIAILGAKTFKQTASQFGIQTNTDFAGVYDFNQNKHLKTCWQNWLNKLQGPMPVVMCHVAVPYALPNKNTIDSDAIYLARLNEYQWLASDEFKALMQAKGFVLND
jgi:chitin disaccharide deacetylase